MFSFFQTSESQIAVILRKFNYSQIFDRFEQKRKTVYNQFFTRLKDAVRREMKSLIIFIDFLQKDRETFKNIDVFVLIRGFFFMFTARTKRIKLLTIAKKPRSISSKIIEKSTQKQFTQTSLMIILIM